MPFHFHDFDDAPRAIVSVVLMNFGSYLLNHINPVMGSISLVLSILYISIKLYKEIRDFWDKPE
jgi:hypothetical protein